LGWLHETGNYFCENLEQFRIVEKLCSLSEYELQLFAVAIFPSVKDSCHLQLSGGIRFKSHN